MTKLRQLLGSTVKASHPLASHAVQGLQYDSRQIGRDELFFAFPGEHVDGHKFVRSALAAGALAYVGSYLALSLVFPAPGAAVISGVVAWGIARFVFNRLIRKMRDR